jgi:pyruvate dehydrogenase E1 component beta subunit
MNNITVRQALRDAMLEEMELDKSVFVIGEEVAEYQGAYKITQGLLERFGPTRVVDTPITEHGFAGLAVGAAFGGLRPVVEFMTFNFAMQAMDQIINSAAKTNYMSGGQLGCPIVFRGPNGAAARVGAQHSQNYSAWFAHVPGLKVIAPYSAEDAKGLLKQAIRYEEDPIIFMESEVMYGDKCEVPEEEYYIEIGKADVKKSGTDVTIVSYNKMMKVALGAAAELEKEGVSAEVIDLRTIRPLDWRTILESVKKTNRLVIVEEQWPFASISSEITYRIQKEGFDYLDAPIRRITSADAPMHYAQNLAALAIPDIERVVKLVKEVMYTRK